MAAPKLPGTSVYRFLGASAICADPRAAPLLCNRPSLAEPSSAASRGEKLLASVDGGLHQDCLPLKLAGLQPERTSGSCARDSQHPCRRPIGIAPGPVSHLLGLRQIKCDVQWGKVVTARPVQAVSQIRPSLNRNGLHCHHRPLRRQPQLSRRSPLMSNRSSPPPRHHRAPALRFDHLSQHRTSTQILNALPTRPYPSRRWRSDL